MFFLIFRLIDTVANPLHFGIFPHPYSSEKRFGQPKSVDESAPVSSSPAAGESNGVTDRTLQVKPEREIKTEFGTSKEVSSQNKGKKKKKISVEVPVKGQKQAPNPLNEGKRARVIVRNLAFKASGVFFVVVCSFLLHFLFNYGLAVSFKKMIKSVQRLKKIFFKELCHFFFKFIVVYYTAECKVSFHEKESKQRGNDPNIYQNYKLLSKGNQLFYIVK